MKPPKCILEQKILRSRTTISPLLILIMAILPKVVQLSEIIKLYQIQNLLQRGLVIMGRTVVLPHFPVLLLKVTRHQTKEEQYTCLFNLLMQLLHKLARRITPQTKVDFYMPKINHPSIFKATQMSVKTQLKKEAQFSL